MTTMTFKVDFNSDTCPYIDSYENINLLKEGQTTLISFPQGSESLFYDEWSPKASRKNKSLESVNEEEKEEAYCEIEKSRGGICRTFSGSPDGRSQSSSEPIYEKLQPPPTKQPDSELESKDILSSEKRHQTKVLLLLTFGLVIILCGVFPAVHLSLANSLTLALVEQRFLLLSDGAWYHFSANATNFDAALKACADMGARSVEVRSVKDHLTLSEHLSTLRVETWWLAATDLAREGEFRWVSDGVRLDSSMLGANESLWAKGQPDNWPDQPGEPEEDCVVMAYNLDGDFRWRWNDFNCESLAHFVCKRM